MPESDRSAPLSHYCIVRGDVPRGLQAAYLVHAAGESSPGALPAGTRAVALHARDEPHIDALADQFREAGVPHEVVTEEDGHRYAIGIRPAADIAPIRPVTSALPLVR